MIDVAVDMPLRFNFHNLVALEVDADRQDDAGFYASEYTHYRTDDLPADFPIVKFRFRRKPALAPLPEGYTFHQHKILARWGYQIRFQPGCVELDVIGNRLAVPMVHHMLLHPSLRYLCTARDVVLLHAGAVAKGGLSLIFTGYGGAGKTTTTSIMLAGGGEGWLPHGDDYIFIAPGPCTLAYMTRAHLYSDLLDWVPEIGVQMKGLERVRLEILSAIRRWTHGGLKWAVRLPVDRLWPGRAVKDSAEPMALILLERSLTQDIKLTPLAENEFSLEPLVAMNFYEARHFLELVQKSGAVPDYPAWLQAWQEDERRLLHQRLAEVPAYILEIPSDSRLPTSSLRQQLVSQLSGLLSGDGLNAQGKK